MNACDTSFDTPGIRILKNTYAITHTHQGDPNTYRDRYSSVHFDGFIVIFRFLVPLTVHTSSITHTAHGFLRTLATSERARVAPRLRDLSAVQTFLS